jgi:hypothetical protein
MSNAASPQLAPETLPVSRWRALGVRIVLTVTVLVLWFWTQSLIGSRPAPGTGIGDMLLLWTTPINHYLGEHLAICNALLIASSGIIDLLAIFLLGSWIFGRTVRPFLGLILVLGLRQLMQALVALPKPPGGLWHYPGFPSLLVTYSVGNDFFFSGHTALAVFGATELIRRGKPWLSALAVAIIIFEISTVLVLRAHYTMDVFTGLVTALLVASFVERLSAPIDRVLMFSPKS